MWNFAKRVIKFIIILAVLGGLVFLGLFLFGLIVGIVGNM